MIIYDVDTTENGYSKLEGEVQSISELKSILTTNERIADCTGYLTIEGLKRNSICIAALSEFGISIAITDAEGVHLTLQDADKLTEVVDVWGRWIGYINWPVYSRETGMASPGRIH